MLPLCKVSFFQAAGRAKGKRKGEFMSQFGRKFLLVKGFLLQRCHAQAGMVRWKGKNFCSREKASRRREKNVSTRKNPFSQ
jgi:hypothetical protein